MSLSPDPHSLIERARALEKYPIARLLSRVERDGEAGRAERARILGPLEATGAPGALVVGVTGAPGTGKSTLVGRLAGALLERDPALAVAVLAIDPSSADSGGALLGDRLRTSFPPEERRIFFRSQASGGDLGGMSRRTFAATRLLRHLFGVIFIETVGIGQSETEIQRIGDWNLLLLSPLGGDHVQFMKAGVMEIPDAFVINKCDEAGLARKARHELETALAYARLPTHGARPHHVFSASARTGAGVDQLAEAVLGRVRAGVPPDAQRRKERYFLGKQVAESHGRFGLAILERVLAAAPAGASFEQIEAAVAGALPATVT